MQPINRLSIQIFFMHLDFFIYGRTCKSTLGDDQLEFLKIKPIHAQYQGCHSSILPASLKMLNIAFYSFEHIIYNEALAAIKAPSQLYFILPYSGSAPLPASISMVMRPAVSHRPIKLPKTWQVLRHLNKLLDRLQGTYTPQIALLQLGKIDPSDLAKFSISFLACNYFSSC